MRLSRSIVLLAGLVAACADPEPFLDLGQTVTVDKHKPITSTGSFLLCYSGKTPEAEVEQLAQEQCGAYGLQPLLTNKTRWQCRFTSPHAASYRCIAPEMRDALGEYINPFDKQAVANWERVNGKKAPSPALPQGPEVTVPPTPAPANTGNQPPPPAPVPKSVLTPADIAGKPAAPKQSLPAQPSPPPPPPLPDTSGFSLPQGSWGDHFQE